MKAERLIMAGVLAACVLQSAAQERQALTPPVSPPAGPAATNVSLATTNSAGMSWLTLSNDTVTVIANARRIKPESVRLEAKSASGIGPFEIDLASATNCALEAEILSARLGASVAVVLEEASSDGQMRTNQTFRNGVVRKIVAPPGKKPLSPGERRLMVWPDGSRPAPPSQFRIAK
jgi:hypothetical protein